MIPTPPLQLSATGQAAALLFVVGTVVAFAVGLFVAARTLRAYRRTGARSLLLFGLGLLLLVSLPTLANVTLATALDDTAVVGPVVESIRLGGALTIAYAIYDR